MKNLFHPIFVAGYTLVICIALFVGCGGCAAGRGTYSPPTGTNTAGVYSPDLPSSTLVVTVEGVRETALGIFDVVMKTEADNRETLAAISPGFHEFAERIRRDGPKILDTLTASKVAFQKSRSEADATALKNSLAVVQSLMSESVKYLAEATTRKAP